MLISDFPFVRSVHLLGNVYLALYFRHTDGWRGMEKEIVPHEKAGHRPRTTFFAAKFPRGSTDRPISGGERRGDERRGNSGERIADRPSQEISKVGTWPEISPSFPFVVADTCLFL